MRLSITVTVLAVSTAYAASGQTLAERFLLTDTLANKPASEVLANPVLTPMLSRVSLSHAAAGFDRASLGKVAVRPTEGKGRAEGWFDADAYIKNGRATITGNASYSNGRRYGVEYCQVSDPEMVFPILRTSMKVNGSMVYASAIAPCRNTAMQTRVRRTLWGSFRSRSASVAASARI